MRKDDAAFATELRIFWGWGAKGKWQAPTNPRVAFANERALYKLYAVREKTETDMKPEDDPCVQLLQLLLPELDDKLLATQ
jgi:hypothetical protein